LIEDENRQAENQVCLCLRDGTRLHAEFSQRLLEAFKRAVLTRGLPPLKKDYLRFQASDGSIHDIPKQYISDALGIDQRNCYASGRPQRFTILENESLRNHDRNLRANLKKDLATCMLSLMQHAFRAGHELALNDVIVLCHDAKHQLPEWALAELAGRFRAEALGKKLEGKRGRHARPRTKQAELLADAQCYQGIETFVLGGSLAGKMPSPKLLRIGDMAVKRRFARRIIATSAD
jgi:hypothetical protein